MYRVLLLLSLCFLSTAALAAVDVYSFDNAAQEQRYQSMIDELRCPKCQNQNLAGSDAPIAQDLRRELHRLIIEGKDDEAIKTFMVQRYGNFVLYRPPLDKNTVLLWGAPLMLLVFGLLIAIRVRQAGKNLATQSLTEEEQHKLAALLQQYGKQK